MNDYWNVRVSDYHEFDTYKRAYDLAGIDTEFEEVEFMTGYVAVFWLKNKDKPVEYIERVKEDLGVFEDRNKRFQNKNE